MPTPDAAYRKRVFILAVCLNAIVAAIPAIAQQPAAVCDDPRLMVGAAAVELAADKSMVIAGGIHPRHVDGQEGELRAVAVVLQQPDSDTLAIVSCDVLMFSRDLLDPVTARIRAECGIRASNVMISATHTHHAPSTVRVHGYDRCTFG
jgi:hypothetical protein